MENRKTELLIPDDVKKYVKGEVVKRILKTVLIFAAVGFILVYYVDTFWEKAGLWTIPIYAAVLIASYHYSKIHKCFTDSTWVGEITDVKVKTVMNIVGKTGGRGTRVRYNNVIILTIRTEDGRDIKFQVYSKDTSNYIEFGSFLKHYKVGVKVVHLYGTKFLQTIPAEGRALTCVICGWYDSDSDDRCDHCKHSLKLVKEDPNAWLWE